jgi:hypothetical protein
VPPWLSPVERLAVNQPIKNGEQPFKIGEDRNQSVIGSNPIGGAKLFYAMFVLLLLAGLVLGAAYSPLI